MSREIDLQQMTVADLAQRCAQETDLYFNRKDSDSSYCLELFRRAIRNRDGDAWKGLIVQYESLVARWVDRWMSQHPDFSSFNEESQDFVAQAFERFWLSYTPAKFANAENNLPAVLKYLQLCVHGALTDTWRKLRRIQLEQETWQEGEEGREFSDLGPTPEDLLQKDELWQLIRNKSKDPKEYLVVYASFHLDLSPRDILAAFPDQFGDINDIYRCKANLLERLERDDEIREYVQRR